MLDATLEVILKACLAQTSQINPLNASLISLALALIIGSISTYNGSCGVARWFSSFHFFSKGFDLKSPTSKGQRS